MSASRPDGGAPDPVLDLVRGEALRPIPPAVRLVAEAARARFGAAVRAILFYGSCLRDGEDRGRLVDLYLLAEDEAAVTPSPLRARLLRLLPPDVYHVAAAFEDRTVRAKVSVMALSTLERAVEPATLEPYFWARFAQPTALLWAADPATADRVHRLLARAIRTLAAEVRPLLDPAVEPLGLFERAFAETYRTELRAEPPERARALVAADAARYRRLGALLLAELRVPGAADRAAAERRWARRRRQGKLRSILRLAKAASTFEGGAEYLAWKIERHSGVAIRLAPWQRRHPRLAGLLLLPRLLRRGAVR